MLDSQSQFRNSSRPTGSSHSSAGDINQWTAAAGILLIARNLPPLVGGMERLNWHMAAELSRFSNLRVIGPRGAAACAPAGIHVREAPITPLFRFLLAAQKRALLEAREHRPEVVLAGSGLTAPLALLAAKTCGARAVTYVHGLDLAISHPVYRSFWLPAIRRMDRVIANSRATAELAVKVGVTREKISIVHPGVTIPSRREDQVNARHFRETHGLGDRPVLLSVGRFTRRKGLREFVVEVLPKIVSAHPDVVLAMVGDAANDALFAESQTRESITMAANAAGVGKNIAFLGVITDRDLGLAYSVADVHVFPIQQIAGDPEGFGMVAIEAAVYGLATVAYKTGGVVDAVAEGVSGHFAPPGDAEGFASAVLEVLAHPLEKSAIRAHAAEFAWPKFGEQLARQLLNFDTDVAA